MSAQIDRPIQSHILGMLIEVFPKLYAETLKNLNLIQKNSQNQKFNKAINFFKKSEIMQYYS